MLSMIFNSFLGDVTFRIKYFNPKLSYKTNEVIDVTKDPVQIDLREKQFVKARGEKQRFVLKKQAEYSISGIVTAKNTNFFLRNVLRSNFDDICLMDIGLAWGKIADKDYIKKYLKFKSTKTLGFSRQLETRCKNCYEMPVSWSYTTTHISHTHLIPASINVMKALLTIKKYDHVKLDGYLVDIYTDKNEEVALTSMSREDTNSTSRGYGSCEDLYVKQVQIGSKVYK